MKEKIAAFFQNEKVKGFARKVFNKKTFTTAAVIIVLVVALRIAFSLLFTVEGFVSKVDGNNITVSNFLTTKTVDIGNFPSTLSSIQVGDRVEIMKNLQGNIISVRDGSKRLMNGRGSMLNDGQNPNRQNGFKGNGGRGMMRRR
jgi:hypothetical protein